MDQKKTNCPSLGGSTTKDEAPLKLRVIGVKVHGIRNYAYIADQNVPGGGNLITEVLRLTLNDLEMKGELPSEEPVLYLQVDNCGENKNRNMFAFLVDLVRRGIFAKVKAGFLMVAHTHEDIDQLFSTVSTHFKCFTTCCPDPNSLYEEIKNAFKDFKHKPTVVVLNPRQIFDYKKLYSFVIDPNIKHHQEPHQFVMKNISGSVLLRYKFWANSSFWLPMATKVPQISSTADITLNQEAPTDRSHTEETSFSKRRKMVRGQLTHGQRAAKVRKLLSPPDLSPTTVDATEDNFSWTPYEKEEENMSKPTNK